MINDIWGDLRRHWKDCSKKERPEREHWTTQEMTIAWKATIKLQNEGWKDVCYCPKDGTVFLAWTPLMQAPFRCNYHGKWPNGNWSAFMDGDMWPIRPVLFKLLENEEDEK